MNDLQVQCDWCQASFVPDPNAFMQGGISVDGGPDYLEHLRAHVRGDPAEKGRLAEQLGLSTEQFEHLLETGQVDTEHIVVCPKCLAKGEVEA